MFHEVRLFSLNHRIFFFFLLIAMFFSPVTFIWTTAFCLQERAKSLYKPVISFSQSQHLDKTRSNKFIKQIFLPTPPLWAGRGGVGQLVYFPMKVIFMPYSSDFHSFKYCFMLVSLNYPMSKITVFSFYTKSQQRTRTPHILIYLLKIVINL